MKVKEKAKKKSGRKRARSEEHLPLPKSLGQGEFGGEPVVFVAREDWDNMVDFIEDLQAIERFERIEAEPPEAFISIEELRRRVLDNRIKEVRKAKGITQVALAKKLGCKQSYVSKIEKKEYRPRASTIRKVAKALGCAPEDLI